MKTKPHAATPAVRDGFEVLDACHREILQHLDRLATLVERLDKSGPDPEARALAREVSLFFSGTARRHHEDEERHVFPPMLSGGDQALTQAVLRLQQDHGWIEQDWLELEPHLDAVAAGISSYDLDELRAGVGVFTALSREHIALEESLIYPQARERMQPGDRQAMAREMAARRK